MAVQGRDTFLLPAETALEQWRRALTLPGCPNLRTSLASELAEYLGLSTEETEERCRDASTILAESWHKLSPQSADQVASFYRDNDQYLYDLTRWHSLIDDTSALANVQALYSAKRHHALTVLDFGSGIGSLGILSSYSGMEITLADIAPQLLAYSRWRFTRRGLRAKHIDLGLEKLPKGHFDFIALVDVLEHLADPKSILKSLKASLKQRGTIFVHVPQRDRARHPMHLRSDCDWWADAFSKEGFWLEGSNDSTMVFRSGNPPRFVLQPGLQLRQETTGGVLYCSHPMLAVRVNRSAYEILRCLQIPRTVCEITMGNGGLTQGKVLRFVDLLRRQRFVQRISPSLASWPSVSIIIPTRNRPLGIVRCLESLMLLDYPHNLLEIIVVDDASDPPVSRDLARMNIILIRQDHNVGQSAARNLAAHKARGDLLAFLDDDCMVAPGWLKALVAWVDSPDVEMVGGRVLPVPSEGAIGHFEAVRSPLDMGPADSEVGLDEVVRYLPSCNLLVWRNTYLALGGFDPRMRVGEDVDFVRRALSAGDGVWYDSRPLVYHSHRTSGKAFLRRRAEYGASECDLCRRHPRERRVMVIPAVVGLLVLAMGIGLAFPTIAIGLILVALATAVLEIGNKLRRVWILGFPFSVWGVVKAGIRQHVAAAYHLCDNLLRYYGLPILLVSTVIPKLVFADLFLLIIPPLVSFLQKEPRLGFARFAALYWLELIAYEVGVWWGCLQCRSLRPLLPRLRIAP